jgi:hypothetical protein
MDTTITEALAVTAEIGDPRISNPIVMSGSRAGPPGTDT